MKDKNIYYIIWNKHISYTPVMCPSGGHRVVRCGLPLAVAAVCEEAERVQKLCDSEGGPEADTEEGQEQQPHGVTRDPGVDTRQFRIYKRTDGSECLRAYAHRAHTLTARPGSWVGGGGEVSCARRMGT